MVTFTYIYIYIFYIVRTHLSMRDLICDRYTHTQNKVIINKGTMFV